jgi:hypothetical protein
MMAIKKPDQLALIGSVSGRSNLAALAVFVGAPLEGVRLRARKLIVKSARGG